MINQNFHAILGALAADPRLWHDFNAICDCGGRRAGTDSEQAALKLVQQRLADIDARGTRVEPVPYAGWRSGTAELRLLDGSAVLACNPLLGTQSTPPQGLVAETLDLGRGTEEQFKQHAKEIPGRIVLVRHEYPFAAGHLHRRRKIGWAMEHGAAGYLIASPFPGNGPVSGSSGRNGGKGIPAVATDYEAAARLAPREGKLPRVMLKVGGEDYAATTDVIVLDLPGRTASWIVLSAHLDGHDLAESALDNASGVAVALAVARAFAPLAAHCQRGLRVCFFSAEEWALAGSQQYLGRMGTAERGSIAVNINLDTVGGDARLTALTSEFAGLDRFVQAAAAQVGMTLPTYRPLMSNSDHYNFARHGIPALRLVAGFDNPTSNIRHILTSADTRDKVAPGELKSAAILTAALAWSALNATDAEIAALR